MSPQLKTLLACMRHAVIERAPSNIGGGIFTPDEVQAALTEIDNMAKALAPKPKPVPWTLQPWMEGGGMPDHWFITANDHIVTSSFVIAEHSRARLARALAWLNEQGDAV